MAENRGRVEGPSLALSSATANARRCHVVVDGIAQGVGFRPFVCRLARSLGLHGSVRNGSSSVLVDVEVDQGAVARFLDQLRRDAPPVAHPRRLTISETFPRHESALFSIETSVRERPAGLYPITAEEAKTLGLPVSTEMPEEVYQFMSLFPQPTRTRPSVEYVPLPYRQGPGRTRSGR